MLVAVSAGRWSDRAGVRRPTVVGSVLLAFGTTLPCALPGLWPLYIAAPLIGVAFSVFQIAAQNATGELGGAVHRARNFGLLSLGQSTSGIIGPLIAGLSIDHLGFAWAFGVLALVPLVPAMALAGGWLPSLPGPHPLHAHVTRGGVLALLGDPRLQRLFVVNALFSLGWELHAIFIPIFGDSIGLSASAIGAVIAAFRRASPTCSEAFCVGCAPMPPIRSLRPIVCRGSWSWPTPSATVTESLREAGAEPIAADRWRFVPLPRADLLEGLDAQFRPILKRRGIAELSDSRAA